MPALLQVRLHLSLPHHLCLFLHLHPHPHKLGFQRICLIILYNKTMVLELTIIQVIFLGILLFLVGAATGIFLSLYFMSRGWASAKQMQQIFAYFTAILWFTFTGYSLVTQGQPLDWFFNAAGFTVVGHVLGINLTQFFPIKK